MVSAWPEKVEATSSPFDQARSYVSVPDTHAYREIDPTGQTNFMTEIWVVSIETSVTPPTLSIATTGATRTLSWTVGPVPFTLWKKSDLSAASVAVALASDETDAAGTLKSFVDTAVDQQAFYFLRNTY
ncbi:MAG: hypothetical protein HY043_24035 [Verrucomicrobia bacterium]|nr:hypothetical protein [Verrucomicrobiota bacterium]